MPMISSANTIRSRAVSTPKLQIVGTRGQILGQTADAGGDTNASQISRLYSVLGKEDVTDLQLLFANWEVGSGTGEADGQNAISVTAAIENPSPAYNWPLLTDAGGKSLSLASGAHGLLKRPGLMFPADSGIWIRCGFDVTAGQYWAIGANPSRSGEASVKSTSPAAQIYLTGALSGGSTAIAAIAPLAVLGIPRKPFVSVVILCDSIGYGIGETSATGDGLGNRGFVQRGLLSVNGHQIPWINEARASDALQVNQLTNGGWRKTLAWKYASHMICNLGTNDIANGKTLAELQAYVLAIWATAKLCGLQVWHVKIMPRMSGSTDSYATPGNMTPTTGFAVGGIRDQFNVWLDTKVADGTINGVIDPNPYVEDQANPSKWVTTGAANYATADGVHPSTALHILAATPVNDNAKTFQLPRAA